MIAEGKGREVGPEGKGSSRDLYIVHGWTTYVDRWDAVAEELAKLGVKAHLLKVPGLTTGEEKEYTIDDYVDWVAGQIPADAIALGHSNGGRILLNAIAGGKLKPSRLILLDSAGIYHRGLRVQITMRLARWFGWLKNVKGLRKIVHRLLRAGDYAKANEGMKRTLENMIESDRNLDLARVHVPTEIIWGQNDKTTPLWQGRKLAQGIAGARLEVVDGWGHSPYLTDPAKLAAKIAEKINA
jgi:pimeloyl-ACP methyl ester carboxylesterase